MANMIWKGALGFLRHKFDTRFGLTKFLNKIVSNEVTAYRVERKCHALVQKVLSERVQL